MNFSGMYFDNDPSDEFRPLDMSKIIHSNQMSNTLDSSLNKQANNSFYLKKPSLSYYNEKLKIFEEKNLKKSSKNPEENVDRKKGDEVGSVLTSSANTSDISINYDAVSIHSESEMELSVLNKTSDAKKDWSKIEKSSFNIPTSFGVVSGIYLDKFDTADSLDSKNIFAITFNEKLQKLGNQTKKNNFNHKNLSNSRYTDSENDHYSVNNKSNKHDFARKSKPTQNNRIDLQGYLASLVHNDANNRAKSIETDLKIETSKNTPNTQGIFNYNSLITESNPIKVFDNKHLIKKESNSKLKQNKHNVQLLGLEDKNKIIDQLKSSVENKFGETNDVDKMVEMAAIMVEKAKICGQISELLSEIKNSIK